MKFLLPHPSFNQLNLALRQTYPHFAKKIAMLIGVFLLPILYNQVQAQVSGTVYKDFNANGAKDNTTTFNEVGQDGVVVKATNPAGTALTVAYTGGGTKTNSTGGYTVTGGTLGQIRLEFTMPDGSTFASKGATSGTTIMFPSAATQNLGVNYPSDYCGIADPKMATSCYTNGDSNASTITGEYVLVGFNYSSEVRFLSYFLTLLSELV